jgi:hypothetical protein
MTDESCDASWPNKWIDEAIADRAVERSLTKVDYASLSKLLCIEQVELWITFLGGCRPATRIW